MWQWKRRAERGSPQVRFWGRELICCWCRDPGLSVLSGRVVGEWGGSVTLVLVCGSRRWPWPTSVETVLERLLARHGERLVVMEGAATGADHAAPAWCERHGFRPERH
ncbi:hypothetical protein BOG92_001450 [Streptomyces sp. WAC00263]|nr:hypothetical protein BOG92_001450 [Streptomyces sp. WAC00263]